MSHEFVAGYGTLISVHLNLDGSLTCNDDGRGIPVGPMPEMDNKPAMEVVLIDYEQPEDVVTVALQEDVDVIGISFMSGGQVETTQKIVAELKRREIADLPVVVGGIIRPFDVAPLEVAGVKEIFRGGAPLADVVATFERLSRAYRGIA